MSELSRREMLKFLGLSAPLFALNNSVLAQIGTAELEQFKRRAERIIREYDAQGIHRTATKVDELSGKWLANLVKEAGAKPKLESFKVNRIDLVENYLLIDNKKFEGIPMFDGGFTDAKGIRGRLGKIGSSAEIGVMEAPPNAATDFNDAFIQARRDSKHKAIIIVTKGGADGIAIINAPYFTNPFAQPALQIGREHGELLMAAAEKNVEVKIVANVKRKKTSAFNVTTEIRGSDTNLAPIGVLTPRSGWWEIASERGGGMCAWLETIRAIAKAKPRRTFYFVASSGHELGHLGLESFLENRPNLAEKALVWLHYGANIGAKNGASRNLRASNEDFEQQATKALTDAGVAPNRIMPRDQIPNGEAKNLHKRNGKYISLIGGNSLFHLPQDRFPDAVDLDVIGRVSIAFSRLAVQLGNS